MCEDYPCCGHTMEDPCGPQEYDAPDYYDTSLPGQEHRLCDHENGECDVDEGDGLCDECGEGEGEHDRCCSENEPYDDSDYVMEDQWLDGSYEE